MIPLGPIFITFAVVHQGQWLNLRVFWMNDISCVYSIANYKTGKSKCPYKEVNAVLHLLLPALCSLVHPAQRMKRFLLYLFLFAHNCIKKIFWVHETLHQVLLIQIYFSIAILKIWVYNIQGDILNFCGFLTLLQRRVNLWWWCMVHRNSWHLRWSTMSL